MVEFFSGVSNFLLGVSAVGFVIFLNRMVKPIGLALEIAAKRVDSKSLTTIIEKLTNHESER